MSQTWSELSGAYTNPELSKQARMIAWKQARCYEAVTKASEFNIGKQAGSQLSVRLYGRITTMSDTALNENQKIPFSKASEYTVTATAYRRGLASVWTGTRADLDRLDVENKVIMGLREQGGRTLNKIVYDALVAARSFCYNALTSSTHGFTTTGTPSGAAVSDFSMYHLRKMRLYAKKYNMPMADGQNYWFFGSPRIEDGLMGDVASGGFVDISKYDPSRVAGLLAGEIGKISNTRFVIDNDRIADDIGTGSVYGSGFMVGADAIHEVMVYPMHFRYQPNLGQDFGNQSAIAWQSLSGYKVVWDYTTHGQANYIHYTST